MFCVLRWWRRLRAGLDDDRRGWPPLDPGLTTPLITGLTAEQAAERDRALGPPQPGERRLRLLDSDRAMPGDHLTGPHCLECDRGHTYRSGCVERLQLSTGQADELAEDDTTRYGYTPPEPGMIDRSGLSIDPW